MNYWDVHGVLFLIGCALFPRITTLFFSAVSFGLLGLIGWLFVPHVAVAIWATTFYWRTNPILCIIAWMFAFGGTSGEGAAVSRGRKHRRRRPSEEIIDA
jgi:hypothetical protein